MHSSAIYTTYTVYPHGLLGSFHLAVSGVYRIAPEVRGE